MERNRSPRIVAADRALALLTLLGSQESLTVTDAARALDVAPSTAHRLLSTLVGRGFAVQDRQRRYAAGPALLRPGQAMATPTLVSRVRPYLERLFAVTGETSHLMVREGAHVRFVDGIEGTQALRVGLRTGLRMPARHTSGGKAMLAELDPAALAALQPSPGAGAEVGSAPSDVASGPAGVGPGPAEVAGLSGALAAVRQQSLGLNQDESEPGVTALGATLGMVDGHHAALTVAVPTARLTTERTRELSEQLLRVCDDARRPLSWAPLRLDRG